MTTSRPRSGIVLLEVLCALTLLASAGVALAAVVSASARAASRGAAVEEQRARQAQLLLVYDLMTPEDLSSRLGGRNVGDMFVTVSRDSPDLFKVTVAPATRAAVHPLTSLLYAPQ